MSRVLKYAQPKCRFTSSTRTVITDAQIIAYPFEAETTVENANTIHCKSPEWNQAEKATLDFSING